MHCSVLCPAFVVSDVFDNFESLRPSVVPSLRATPEGAQAVEGMKGLMALGLTARAAGEQVVQAIRERRFYVLTHPHWSTMIQNRLENILEGRDPVGIPPPAN